MKPIFIALLSLSLCGCGLEVAGTAATGASIKKKELEEGQKTMERVEQRIDQMNLQSEGRIKSLDD